MFALRYCDVLQNTPLPIGEVGYLVIFKLNTGRSKSVAPVHEPGGNTATPDPTFDCYTSAEFALYTSMLNDPSLLLYNNSQVRLPYFIFLFVSFLYYHNIATIFNFSVMGKMIC